MESSGWYPRCVSSSWHHGILFFCWFWFCGRDKAEDFNMEHASIISYWERKSGDLSKMFGGFMFSQAVLWRLTQCPTYIRLIRSYLKGADVQPCEAKLLPKLGCALHRVSQNMRLLPGLGPGHGTELHPDGAEFVLQQHRRWRGQGLVSGEDGVMRGEVKKYRKEGSRHSRMKVTFVKWRRAMQRSVESQMCHVSQANLSELEIVLLITN